MLSKNLIVEDFPYLKPTDTGNVALDIMENYLINHLAIVDENRFLGLVSMDDIYNFELFETKVESFKQPLIRAYVFENQHIFDVMKTMQLFDVSVLPVLDKQENFRGIITQRALINAFANIMCVRENGYFLVLKLLPRDFSATEISNIIEKNDGKLLSLYIDDSIGNGLRAYLKIQSHDIEAILQSFERFNYDVTLLNIESNDYDKLYRDRFDNLLNFLNI